MKKYTRFIGLLVLFLILYLIDLKKLFINLSGINSSYLFLSIILNIPHLYFKSLRWNLLLRQQAIFYSKTESFLIYMSSLYIGFLTPGRLGEFVKVLYLRNDKKISIGTGFSRSLFSDRSPTNTRPFGRRFFLIFFAFFPLSLTSISKDSEPSKNVHWFFCFLWRIFPSSSFVSVIVSSKVAFLLSPKILSLLALNTKFFFPGFADAINLSLKHLKHMDIL